MTTPHFSHRDRVKPQEKAHPELVLSDSVFTGRLSVFSSLRTAALLSSPLKGFAQKCRLQLERHRRAVVV